MLQIIVDFGTRSILGLELPLRIYGYGLMLVLGFLAAILLAQWRARRAGEDPEHVSRIGLLSLLGGIVGSRAAYIIQHPDSFDGIGAMLNVTSGGLIYYGGVILAAALVVAYLLAKRLPVRRYLDIVAASLMIGLAFGRAGCTLNGCCFGAPCDDHWPLGLRFPMFSRPLIKLDGRANPFSADTMAPTPPYAYQLSPQRRPCDRVRPPPALLSRCQDVVMKVPGGQFPTVTAVHPPRYLHGRLHNDQTVMWADPNREAMARRAFYALSGGDGRLDEGEWQAGVAAGAGLLRGSEHWDDVVCRDGQTALAFADVWTYLSDRRQRFDTNGDGRLDQDERAAANAVLQADEYAAASAARSLPTKPAQVLGMVNALLLAGLLLGFHRLRRREGQVFALLLVLYPLTRFVLESIRADNPHNLLAGTLTHNQYTSLAVVTIGILMWLVLRRLPAAGRPPVALPQKADVSVAPASGRRNDTR